MSGDNRRRRETERRNGNKSEEIRTENIPKLMAETTLQIRDARRAPRRTDAFQRLLPPNTPTHVRAKLRKIKDEEKILK